MTETTSDDEIPKTKKKGKLKPILFGTILIVLLGGGGAAGGFYAAGMMGEGHEEPEDPNKPKIIMKDGTAISGSHGTGAAGCTRTGGTARQTQAKKKATRCYQ